MSRGLFVTGTDTEVGKTLFSAALLHRLGETAVPAAGFKPVSAGCRREGGRLVNEDAELLQEAAPVRLPLDMVNPVALEPAIAPHLAAAEAGTPLSVASLARAWERVADRARFVLVEGAGGWRVPLDAGETLADLARRLELPVVMVVGLRLGCLNHALLTAEAVRADGLELTGWVANVLDARMPRLEGNIETLQARLDCPLVARIPPCRATTAAGRALEAAGSIPQGEVARLARMA